MRTRRARAQARGRRFGAIHPARGGGGAHAPARTGVQAGAGGAQAVRRGNRRRVPRHDGRRAQQGFTTRPAGAPRGSPFKRRRAFPKSINRFFPKVPPPPPDVMTNATSPTFLPREASESDALSSHPSPDVTTGSIGAVVPRTHRARRAAPPRAAQGGGRRGGGSRHSHSPGHHPPGHTRLDRQQTPGFGAEPRGHGHRRRTQPVGIVVQEERRDARGAHRRQDGQGRQTSDGSRHVSRERGQRETRRQRPPPTARAHRRHRLPERR